MDENGKLKRFGRYLLLDHLVDGGMAKIFRARFLSEDVDRLVAIKMIQSKFFEDENFKKMFLDEIKLTFALNHPNIAQIYDYGFYQDQLYTAMEFVDGKNLKQFLDCLKKRNYVFPIENSVYIIAQVCQGLSYAYNSRDKLSGKELNIIHRDISPHNIMLNFDGVVKIIDFGIAKSSTNSDHTKAGTIKGKLSYLAPECLSGEELDHRYDQFAVGITLWELLCSRKLFYAKNGLAVLKQIQACKVPPPSHINPNVPAELDKIVMKSLARDKENRFEDMDQFNRILVRFLYSHYPNFNSSDLCSFAKSLFKEEIKRDRAKLFEFGKIDISSYVKDWEDEANNKDDESTQSMVIENKGANFYLCDIKDINESADDSKIALKKDPNSFVDDIEEINKDLLARPNPLGRRVVRTSQERVYRKRRKIRRSIVALLIIIISYSERNTVLKHPPIKKYVRFIFPSLYPDQNKVRRDIASLNASQKMGILRIKGFRQSVHKLLVNGETVDYKLFFVKLPLGVPYRIEVVEEGKKSFIREFILTEQGPEVRYEII